MAIFVNISKDNNRIDVSQLEKLFYERKGELGKPLAESTEQEGEGDLPKGLDAVVEKYSRLNKGNSRTPREDYDYDDDFIDDSEVVEFDENWDELSTDEEFYICSMNLEEPADVEPEKTQQKDTSISLDDSFSEGSQPPPRIKQRYEDLCSDLPEIPQEVKDSVIALRDELERKSGSKINLSSTLIAPQIKNLFHTAALSHLATKASFGENGSVHCRLDDSVWSHVMTIFKYGKLRKYRCSKSTFEAEAFFIFHKEWQHKVKKEVESQLSELKVELQKRVSDKYQESPEADTETNNMTEHDGMESKRSLYDDEISGTASQTEIYSQQTQESGQKEDDTSSSTPRRKRKAATIAAEGISNLAFHGTTQSPLKKKKKKLTLNWDSHLDRLVYNVMVNMLSLMRAKGVGKQKKNENAECAKDLWNSTFSDYNVTERDILDAYRRFHLQVKHSERQKRDEEKQERKRTKEERAQQRRLKQEQNGMKRQILETEGSNFNLSDAVFSSRETQKVSKGLEYTGSVDIKNIIYVTENNATWNIDKKSREISLSSFANTTNREPPNQVTRHFSLLGKSSTDELDIVSTLKELEDSKRSPSRKEKVGKKGYQAEDNKNARDSSYRKNTSKQSTVMQTSSQKSSEQEKKQYSKKSPAFLSSKVFLKLATIASKPSSNSQLVQKRIPTGFANEVASAIDD
eukprot:jgi/Galph1/5843/GphlegSOOS_G4514.1